MLGLQDLHHLLSDALAQPHLQVPVHPLLLAESFLMAVARIERMQKLGVPVGSPQALVPVAAANTAPACTMLHNEASYGVVRYDKVYLQIVPVCRSYEPI